jgi:hypothetical protein
MIRIRRDLLTRQEISMVNTIPRKRHILSRREQATQDQTRKKSKSPPNPAPPAVPKSGGTQRPEAASLSSRPTRAPLLSAQRPLFPHRQHSFTGRRRPWHQQRQRREKKQSFSLLNRAPHLLPLLRLRHRTGICLRHRQAAAAEDLAGEVREPLLAACRPNPQARTTRSGGGEE